ncbi:MAG: hypothetical protein IPG82_05785 [Saprospiraceae bacterium]|jgi:hypothetical protein|nr:hypothetical protein [Saprospiraceae bacterium]MBK6814961.1 hypothetical protein [Saprospiraceae bacterium]MBK7606190.1 hypothetical protein [Saprospiraceae bacterium]MBK8778063.1 hypothetical protein [Saprospiraceae bacterium]MBL0112946.1 hypothetical protein [Saprospiraceae bacterium]
MLAIIHGLIAGILMPRVVSACMQKTDNNKHINTFSGSVGMTNNGISLLSTFSLSKRATIFNLSMSKGKLNFEPEAACPKANPSYLLLKAGQK